MSDENELSVFSLLQPDLLSEEELISKIQERFPHLRQTLSEMSKEQLVTLFRRTVLPLPQRVYRQDRRGRALTERRIREGLQGSPGGKDKCFTGTSGETVRASTAHDRLKPPPDMRSTNRQDSRSGGQHKTGREVDLDKIIINDRQKRSSGEPEAKQKRTSTESVTLAAATGRRIVLKRTTSESKPSETSETKTECEAKKTRTAIQWP